MDTTIREQVAIPARIDRLPVSREIWGIMLLAGIAWLVESYDVGVIGSVLPSVVKEFHLGAFGEGLFAYQSRFCAPGRELWGERVSHPASGGTAADLATSTGRRHRLDHRLPGGRFREHALNRQTGQTDGVDLRIRADKSALSTINRLLQNYWRSSTAPRARRVAFCASVSPFTPVISSRS